MKDAQYCSSKSMLRVRMPWIFKLSQCRVLRMTSKPERKRRGGGPRGEGDPRKTVPHPSRRGLTPFGRVGLKKNMPVKPFTLVAANWGSCPTTPRPPLLVCASHMIGKAIVVFFLRYPRGGAGKSHMQWSCANFFPMGPGWGRGRGLRGLSLQFRN